jgi:hypothetical protein
MNNMPPKGYRSVTVPDEICEYFEKKWRQEKEKYRREGVRSFSGFITYNLSKIMRQEEQANSGSMMTYRCDKDDFTATGSVKEVVQAYWDHEAAQHDAPPQTWEMLNEAEKHNAQP